VTRSHPLTRPPQAFAGSEFLPPLPKWRKPPSKEREGLSEKKLAGGKAGAPRGRKA